MSEPQVGQRFPSIALLAQGNKEVRIPEDFQGKNLVLSWYPFAFSPVCTEEFTGFARVHTEFTHLQTEVVAASCDHWYSGEAFKSKLGAPFAFLSDWSKGAARRLGILDEAAGRSGRAIFVIDRDGALRWKKMYETKACPKVDDFLGELKKLT